MTPRHRPAPAWVTLALLLGACGSNVATPTATAIPTEPASPSPTASPRPDNKAPAIVAQHPPPGATVPLAGQLHVAFSEPVVGVDGSRFRLRDAAGTEVPGIVRTDADSMGATLVPTSPLTVATSYSIHVAGKIRDLSGNRLTPATWHVRTSNAVRFAARTYTGYEFGYAPDQLISIRRATLASPSTATASEYRVIGEQGYLLIDSGTWSGLWVHGDSQGNARDDATAPITPLPACAYHDLPTARPAIADWATTVLDNHFMLPPSYAPADLVDTAVAGLNGGYRVRAVVMDDLAAMVAAARADGAYLAVQSAYRSYDTQVLTFNGWVREVGYANALRVAARPGHSEHQLGTGIDFRSAGGNPPWQTDWGLSREGSWLAANGWRYGWVMSYPAGTAERSCYSYEPWHYRYYGRDIARAIHESGLTAREWLWAQGYGVR